MSPTRRTAFVAFAIAFSALAIPSAMAWYAALALMVAVAVDALFARTQPHLARACPSIVARGVAAPLRVRSRDRDGAHIWIRQPQIPDVTVTPSEARGALDAVIVATRRGRHVLPAVAAKRIGPLGLGAWQFRGDGHAALTVYPDVFAARRIAHQVRTNRFRTEGLRRQGPLGLGTEFESIREFFPDDDLRQLNWSATTRLGRPMVNQYRVEQDRDVVCMVDAGRLMAAPTRDRTRLDAALDATVAIGYVADEVGDRVGAIAFDSEIRRNVATRRRGAAAVIGAVYDLESRDVDSDYERAFRTLRNTKRALVIVFTDLVDEAAAQALLSAMPILSRRHAVIVASATDLDLRAASERDAQSVADFYEAVVAHDVLAARRRVVAALRASGATLIESPPESLAAACVAGYLSLKHRARL